MIQGTLHIINLIILHIQKLFHLANSFDLKNIQLQDIMNRQLSPLSIQDIHNFSVFNTLHFYLILILPCIQHILLKMYSFYTFMNKLNSLNFLLNNIQFHNLSTIHMFHYHIYYKKRGILHKYYLTEYNQICTKCIQIQYISSNYLLNTLNNSNFFRKILPSIRGNYFNCTLNSFIGIAHIILMFHLNNIQ